MSKHANGKHSIWTVIGASLGSAVVSAITTFAATDAGEAIAVARQAKAIAREAKAAAVDAKSATEILNRSIMDLTEILRRQLTENESKSHRVSQIVLLSAQIPDSDWCLGKKVTIRGSSNGETLFGTSGIDVIRGGRGNDLILADNGRDLVCGGIGDDALVGGNGKDGVNGNWGFDRCSGENRKHCEG